MTRSWTALAVFLFLLGVAGCNDYNNSVQYDTGATLTNLSPSGLPVGTPTSGTLINCPNTPSGQVNPCFTLYVIASSSNPFTTPGVNPVVQWNGKKITTTYIDTTNLSAQVPYSYITSPGTVAVNVYQPTGQGTGYNGLSNALTFTIYGQANPYPTLSSVSPTSAAYCDSTSAACAGVPITVTGKNFIPATQNGGSQVTITGASTYNQETAVTVTSYSSTQLKATIPGKLLCASGTTQINVLNPPSAICLLNCPNLGGGDTNNPPAGQPVTTQTFTITNSTSVNTCPANVPPGTTTTAVEKAAISQDGRYVAYASEENGVSQVLLHDTCLGVKDCVSMTRTISMAADSTPGNGNSHNVSMTPDGRYVAFSSSASNLVENSGAGQQIFLRDTCNGANSCKPGTQVVSVDKAGILSGKMAELPSVSASGRYVAFLAANATAGSTTNSTTPQVYVRDTCIGAESCTPKTTLLSSAALVTEDAPAISRDGRYVAYTSSLGDSWQIVLADTCVEAASACKVSTRAISIAPDGSVGDGASHNAVMTADGRYVAFSSAATNLTESAPLGRQIYLRDTCAGATGPCKASTVLVSTDEQGALSGTEGILPSLSASGRYVAFLAVSASQSGAATTPNSGLRQVFVRDTCLGTSDCVAKATRISLQPGYIPAETAKPAGPAIAGFAKQVALGDGKNATMFTPTIALDDRVLLAIPSGNN
jgi:Tol biopolymer transport system component